MEQPVPEQLRAALPLIPAALPGGNPSAHFRVFEGLLWQRWVQFKVFMGTPKAWGALPLCSQQSPRFSSTSRAPPWISAVVPSRGGHLPWNPTLPITAGAWQPSGCAYKAVFAPARLPARHFILIFFVLGHVRRREDKLLKIMWISACFNPGQPDRAATGDSGNKAVDPTHCSQARPSLASSLAAKDLRSKLLFWKEMFHLVKEKDFRFRSGVVLARLLVPAAVGSLAWDSPHVRISLR